MIEEIRKDLADSAEALQATARTLAEPIAKAVDMIVSVLKAGGRVFTFGNGGSASDATHIAGELVGRFMAERPGLAAEALTTDMATMTSVANDYAFENIFARQIQAKGKAVDVAIGLSTSGTSPNVVAALRQAKEMGMQTIVLSGRDGGPCGELADVLLNVPDDCTPRIQESHAAIYHAICKYVEQAFVGQ